ncbi:MarR family winged helix-turn-helix transcriptional regulator [Pseudarthrobacter sp. J1763]
MSAWKSSTVTWLRMARFVANSNRISSAHLSNYELTVAQFEALAHVRAHEPVTQGDLAAALTVSPGGASRMVDRLQQAGLITREQRWKTKFISLTPEGRSRLEGVYAAQIALQASLFEEALNADEQRTLNRLMKKLLSESDRRLNLGE